MLRVLQPEYLLLLLLVPFVWIMARSVRVLGKGRKTLALLLRTLVLILFILALAEVEIADRGRGLTVFFVMDRSASVPIDEQRFALSWIQQRLGELPPGDRAEIIFFGKNSAIQERPNEYVSLVDYLPMVDVEGTDIESAINLAMAAFPEGTQRRIVLLTDGNQTQGDAEAAIRRARANDVDVRIFPLRYLFTQDVMIDDVVLPARIREHEPFNVRVMISALEAGEGQLRIFENNQVIVDEWVRFNEGKNAFSVTRDIPMAGVYSYEAHIEVENDRRPWNNQAQNYAVVRGQPRVLLIDGDPAEARFLAAALQREGIIVDRAQPEEIPPSLRELQAYDGVILSNISADRVDNARQRAIETAVRDLGVGLVMLGGPDAFGAGGWQGTPVERALPLDMDIQQRRIMPSGALVLIMHSCEIAQGNYWSQRVSEEAVRLLGRNDYAGFLRYHYQDRESWLFPLEPLGDKRRQMNLIRNLAIQDIGDMPSFDPTLEMAYEALVNTPANVKHIVILSDGDPAPPSPSLMQRIRDARITVSTVCVNPHTPADVQRMREIAEYFGGEAYYIQNNNELPQIFIKEAMVVRRNTLIEETFDPVIVSYNELITGINAFPPLHGYVVASPKPTAEIVLITHEDDPLLANWRYGVGKAVAFTSDAKSRWGADWLSWEQYTQFWGQVVRWSLRAEQEENFHVQTRVEGDQIRISVDALTEEGEFLNQLNFSAVAIDPELQSTDVALRQTQPGRYESVIPAKDSGSYIIKMNFEDDEGREGQLTAGVSVPFSPEYSTFKQNDAFLRRMADAGGRPLLAVNDPIFQHDLVASGRTKPLWPTFLALAILLFFLDVAVRRVFFELPQLQAAWSRVWDWIRDPFHRKMAPVGPATEPIGRLMQAKQQAQRIAPQTLEAKEQLLRQLDDASLEERPVVETATATQSADWREVKSGESAPAFEDAEHDAYTSALIRAKQRASERMRER